MGIYDVPASALIEEVAKELKNHIKQPGFVPYVKTGAHRERAPNNPDWFYLRNASILYRLYKNGATGTGSLRTYYGGRKNRGVKPEKKVKASGKIIRTCLQSLEKAGLLKKEKKGRVVSGKGEKLLYAKAKEIEVTFKVEIMKKDEDKKQRIEKARQAREKALREIMAKKNEANAQEQRAEAKKQQEAKAHEQKSEAPKQEQKANEDDRRGKPEAEKA